MSSYLKFKHTDFAAEKLFGYFVYREENVFFGLAYDIVFIAPGKKGTSGIFTAMEEP